jgi:formylglycine-generating enzyme required for sulfatase activity
MSIRIAFLMCAAILAGCINPTRPPAATTTKEQPSVDMAKLEAEARTLVVKLGHDDYLERDAAQKRLEAMPTAALPAVKAEIEGSSDPETRQRGGMALKVLEARAEAERIARIPSMTNSVGMKLVLIPAGEFLMGSPETEKKRSADEGPQHKVRITKSFYMGTTEVTQAQWRAVMGQAVKGMNFSYFRGDNLPVENKSWNDCQEFIKKLSANEGMTYRLPTEAEWEYACRAGTTTPFNTGETISTDQANYDGNNIYGNGVKGAFRQKTTPVGGFKPNAWGLYDMHGNVWEWCEDWYDSSYYRNSLAADPTGPARGASRVLRGGSWKFYPKNCRSSSRNWYYPDSSINYIGFRVVALPQSGRDGETGESRK